MVPLMSERYSLRLRDAHACAPLLRHDMAPVIRHSTADMPMLHAAAATHLILVSEMMPLYMIDVYVFDYCAAER